MENIKIKLSRQNLIDDFKIENQKFNCSIEPPLQALYRLENIVNTYFKDKEHFCVIAIISLKNFYSYEFTKISKSCEVELLDILDFDKNSLFEKYKIDYGTNILS